MSRMKIYNDCMQTEMRHLELVRAVAQAGSLTRAGLVLNLTQSALSHQLRDIETRLTPMVPRNCLTDSYNVTNGRSRAPSTHSRRTPR